MRERRRSAGGPDNRQTIDLTTLARWVPSANMNLMKTTTATKLSHSVFARDFSAVTRRALLKKGIAVIGITNVPGPGGDYANGSRGYQLSNAGTFMIRGYFEVIALAA